MIFLFWKHVERERERYIFAYWSPWRVSLFFVLIVSWEREGEKYICILITWHFPWRALKLPFVSPGLSLKCKWLPKRSECKISNRWSKNKYLISFKVFSKLQFSIPKRPPFVRQSCPLKVLKTSISKILTKHKIYKNSLNFYPHSNLFAWKFP